jgi:hypothetical protein
MIDRCPSDGLDWINSAGALRIRKKWRLESLPAARRIRKIHGNRFSVKYRGETRISANKNVSNQQPFR